MAHDLLDLLEAQDVPEGTLHALLPNMGLACPLDLLEVIDQGRIRLFGLSGGLRV